MERITLQQVRYLLGLMEDISGDKLDALLDSGLLKDLFEADPLQIDRYEFRKFLTRSIIDFHTTGGTDTAVVGGIDLDVAEVIDPATTEDFNSDVAEVISLAAAEVDDPLPAEVINLDATPFVPKGYHLLEHIKGGQFEWDPAKVILWLDQEQETAAAGVKGEDLLKKLPMEVFNANLLDWLLANPQRIPHEWRLLHVFFWGTKYTNDGRTFIRCLSEVGGKYRAGIVGVERYFSERYPAAVFRP